MGSASSSAVGVSAGMRGAVATAVLAVGAGGISSLLILVGAANYRSVMLGAGIQNVFSFAKVVALVSLAIFVMTLGDPAAGSLAAGFSWAPASLPGFLLALVRAWVHGATRRP
mgnify:CR=1 FL=1